MNMKETMQEAFEAFFEKQRAFYRERMQTEPSVPYSEDLNPALLISEEDEDGEVQWRPVLQPQTHDWSAFEKTCGFALREELKAFYNTYFFLSMSGRLDGAILEFYAVDGTVPLDEIASNQLDDASDLFPGSQRFLIGGAELNDNDDYFIFYDNADGTLFCYENNRQRYARLPGGTPLHRGVQPSQGRGLHRTGRLGGALEHPRAGCPLPRAGHQHLGGLLGTGCQPRLALVVQAGRILPALFT